MCALLFIDDGYVCSQIHLDHVRGMALVCTIESNSIDCLAWCFAARIGMYSVCVWHMPCAACLMRELQIKLN